VNFDASELVYEDGPHAARRSCILGFGCGVSQQAQADEWEQRARSEPKKPRAGQSG
jgi:hypothetical protein